MSRHRFAASLLTLSLLAAACGDDGPAGAPTTAPAAPGATEAPTTTATAAPESPAPSPPGGGTAVLAVGDRSWEFDNAECYFGEEAIGDPGAEFVLSAISDGLQLYVSVDSFGHSVDVFDIEDFENPSVSLRADDVSASLAGTAPVFVRIEGKRVTAEGSFLDNTADGFDTVPGTLVATCP